MAADARVSGPILLITDLSPRCDRAMDRAAALAKMHGVCLIALHVMDTPWLAKLTQPAWHSLQQDNIALARKQLQTDLSHAGVELTVLVETGNPVEVIEQVAKDNQCSLIVSGTAREETLGRLVLGNTVERLARRASTPLLIVRARAFAPYAKILMTTDFSGGAKQALMFAQALFGQANITLYHAFEEVAGIYQLDGPTVKEQIQALASKAHKFAQSTPGLQNAELPAVIEHGTPHELVPVYVQANHIDLVVMGTHGVTGVVRAAMGSVAEKLLASLRCDVLIVPQTKP